MNNLQINKIEEKQFYLLKFTFLILLFFGSISSQVFGQSARFYPEKTDYYTISLNGKNMSFKGTAKAEANIELATPNGQNNQQFRFIEQLKNGKSTNFYLIETKVKKGLYLTVDYARIAAGTNIKLNPRKNKNQLWTFKNGAIETALSTNKFIGLDSGKPNNLAISDKSMKFTFTKINNIAPPPQAPKWASFTPATDYFFISNVANNKVVNVMGATTKVGTNVGMYGKHSKPNQKFKFISKGSGYYAIETALKKDIFLSIHNSAKADKTNIKLNNPVGQQQHFKIEKNTAGEVRFISKLGSDLYLGMSDDGNNLVLRKGDKGKKLIFKLTRTTPPPPTPTINITADQQLGQLHPASQVDAILDHTGINGKAYFFKGDQYCRYDIKKNKVDPGFPKKIKGNWNGWKHYPNHPNFSENLDAVVNYNNKVAYIFKDNYYLKYDLVKKKVMEGYPKYILDGWNIPKKFLQIDAAYSRYDGKVYFFSGDEYLRYDVKQRKVDPGYPKKTAPNFAYANTSFKSPTAAFRLHGKDALYFWDDYRQCFKYNVATNKKYNNNYPQKISHSHWNFKTASSFSKNNYSEASLVQGPWQAVTPPENSNTITYRSFFDLGYYADLRPLIFKNTDYSYGYSIRAIDAKVEIREEIFSGVKSRWFFTDMKNGYYRIGLVEGKDKKVRYLSVHESQKSDGTNIKLNYEVPGDNQEFRFEKNPQGMVRIVSKLGDDLYIGRTTTVAKNGDPNIVLRKGFSKYAAFLWNPQKTNSAPPAPSGDGPLTLFDEQYASPKPLPPMYEDLKNGGFINMSIIRSADKIDIWLANFYKSTTYKKVSNNKFVHEKDPNHYLIVRSFTELERHFVANGQKQMHLISPKVPKGISYNFIPDGEWTANDNSKWSLSREPYFITVKKGNEFLIFANGNKNNRYFGIKDPKSFVQLNGNAKAKIFLNGKNYTLNKTANVVNPIGTWYSTTYSSQSHSYSISKTEAGIVFSKGGQSIGIYERTADANTYANISDKRRRLYFVNNNEFQELYNDRPTQKFSKNRSNDNSGASTHQDLARPPRPNSQKQPWKLEGYDADKILNTTFVKATETKFPSSKKPNENIVDSGKKLAFAKSVFKEIKLKKSNGFKDTWSKDAAIQKVTDGLNQLLPNQFQLSNVDIGKDSEGNYELKGIAKIFEIDGTTLTSIFQSSKEIQSVVLDFPNTTDLAVKILDKLTGVSMDSYLPNGIPSPSINQLQINFNDRGNGIDNITIEGGSREDWNPISVGSFGVDDLTINMSIDNPSQNSREVAVSLNGKSNLGSIPMRIKGSVNSEKGNVDLIVNGNAKNLSLGNLLRAIGGEEANDILAAIPASFGNLAVKNLEASINAGQRSFVGEMDADFGQLEIAVQPKKNGGQGIMLGIKLPSTEDLAKIDDNLSVLTDLALTDIAFVLSSYNGKAKTTLPTIGQSVSGEIVRGLNLSAKITLEEQIKKIVGVSSLSLNSSIPRNPMNMILEAGIDGEAPLGGGVTFKKMRLGIKPSPTDFTMFIGGTLAAHLDDTDLEFDGLMKMKPTDAKLEVQFLLSALGNNKNGDAEWKEPFGVPGVGISGLGLNVGIGLKPPLPLPSVGVLGDLKLGTTNKRIEGRAVVMADVQNPQKSMIDAKINTMSILSIIEAFDANTKIEGDFRKALNSGLEDVIVRVVPSPLTIFNESYEPGLNIKGKADIFGINGNLDILFDPESKLSIFGTVDKVELKEGGFTFFALKGAGNKPKPEIDMLLDASGDMHFLINGNLTLLGLSRSAQIEIDKSGLAATIEGNLFGKNMLSASLTVSGKDFENGGDFRVKAVMKNKLQKEISQKVQNFLDDRSKKAQAELKKLERELEKAKNANVVEQAFVDLGKKTVGVLREMDKEITNAANYLIKGAFEELLYIKSASFEAQLKTVEKAMVDMQMEGTIVGQDFDEKFRMELNTQETGKMIEKLAEEIGEDILNELKNSALNPIEDVLDDAEKFFTDLGNEIADFAADRVDDVENAGNYVGGKVEDGYNGLGDALGFW